MRLLDCHGGTHDGLVRDVRAPRPARGACQPDSMALPAPTVAFATPLAPTPSRLGRHERSAGREARASEK